MTVQHTPRFQKEQINKLRRLLDMLYKPSEIADQLGVELSTVYKTYLEAGCPKSKDRNGRVWINGIEFRKWAEEILEARRGKKRARLAEDQAYCLRCNQVVTVAGGFAFYKTVNSGIDMTRGTCPKCGHEVYRTASRSNQSTSKQR